MQILILGSKINSDIKLSAHICRIHKQRIHFCNHPSNLVITQYTDVMEVGYFTVDKETLLVRMTLRQ